MEKTFRQNREGVEVMELEDKIRCNELLKEKHSNWLGLSNQKAIRSMLEELDRLQGENDLAKKALNANSYEADERNNLLAEVQRLKKENEKYANKIILSDEEYRKVIEKAQKDCISKDKIRELISKINVDIKTNDRRMIMYEEEKGTSRYVCKLIAYDPRSLKIILQDLLKEE